MMAFWILTRHIHCYGLGMECPQNNNMWRTWSWWVGPWDVTEHESTHWWMHNWVHTRRRWQLWKAEPGWSWESIFLKGLSCLEPLPLHVSFCFLTAGTWAASIFVTFCQSCSSDSPQPRNNRTCDQLEPWAEISLPPLGWFLSVFCHRIEKILTFIFLTLVTLAGCYWVPLTGKLTYSQ